MPGAQPVRLRIREQTPQERGQNDDSERARNPDNRAAKEQQQNRPDLLVIVKDGDRRTERVCESAVYINLIAVIELPVGVKERKNKRNRSIRPEETPEYQHG